jgi:hypothetical protein
LKTLHPHDAASQLADPPGASPFAVKGVAYLGHLDYCEHFLPGGRAAFMEALPDGLQRFFRQKFLPGNWYDVFPLAAAGFICADLMGVSFHEFVRVRSRAQAQADATGVYRIFFTFVSPRLVASKMPTLLSLYFDFGKVAILRREPTLVEVAREEVPALLVLWQNAVFQGFLEVVLPLAGAKSVAVTYGEPQPTGQKGGYEIVTVPMTLSWT